MSILVSLSFSFIFLKRVMKSFLGNFVMIQQTCFFLFIFFHLGPEERRIVSYASRGYAIFLPVRLGELKLLVEKISNMEISKDWNEESGVNEVDFKGYVKVKVWINKSTKQRGIYFSYY